MPLALFLFLSCIVAATPCIGATSGVVQLTVDDFDAVVRSGTEVPWFVLLVRPGCSACSAALQELARLGESLESRVRVAEADVSQRFGYLAAKWEVEDLPALKLIRDGSVYTYHGPPTFDAMSFFVDPPERYLGWEIAPPEEMPEEPGLAKRLLRKCYPHLLAGDLLTIFVEDVLLRFPLRKFVEVVVAAWCLCRCGRALCRQIARCLWYCCTCCCRTATGRKDLKKSN